ncbi:hypothetical protein H8D04_00510 [bacterium]|nr:hypothetical protein [bacterium]
MKLTKTQLRQIIREEIQSLKEAVKDPKLKVGQKIRFDKANKVFTLKKITHGNVGIPEDPAGTSYMFVGPGNAKEYFTKKTWNSAVKKGWLKKESINEGGQGVLDKDQADVLQAIVMMNKKKSPKAILKIAMKDRMLAKIPKQKLAKYIEEDLMMLNYM